MEIVFKDEHIVVCIKPPNVLSEGDGERCMPKLLSCELEAQGECNTGIFPVHRLDKETVGVMVYARTSAAAAALSRSIVDGNFKKKYLAVVHGTPKEEVATLEDLLFFDRGRGQSFIVDRSRKGVKQAALDYSLVDSKNGLSLLEITLRTGRTHQIRAQLSHRSMPLVGDRRYGAPKSDAATVTLLARQLCFPHPIFGEMLSFIAPIPASYPWHSFEIH